MKASKSESGAEPDDRCESRATDRALLGGPWAEAVCGLESIESVFRPNELVGPRADELCGRESMNVPSESVFLVAVLGGRAGALPA
ncbi:hypothetical protein NEMBOFW57_000704 [Staphylotrichum longicolle]|uniref:Uncharacterized protein n=1 Tax=Staphylotrichum longicolle TaxID=669026 RepID=A0AAD4I151_9PEZI|nr:hypothetical protein NEMBOFW57_000704 [Staphylotrichum longicolle]